jgi:hypothetical protein
MTELLNFAKTFYADFAKLRFFGKVAVLFGLCVVVLVGSVALYPQATAQRFAFFTNYWRAYRAGETGVIPLNGEASHAVNYIKSSLKTSLEKQAKQNLATLPSNPKIYDVFNAWTWSQIAIADPSFASDNKKAIDSAIDLWKYDSRSWREFPDDPICEIHVNAWVIYGRAKALHEFDADPVDYLIQQQGAKGHWCIYPDVSDSDYACTYATCVAILALDAVHNEANCTGELRKRVEKALERGRKFLLSAFNTTDGLFSDYPMNPRIGTARVGLSSLAIYALYSTSAGDPPPQLREIALSWLRRHTVQKHSLNANEVSGANVAKRGIDHVRLYVHPCELLAFPIAYRYADLPTRAEALTWFNDYCTDLEGAESLSDDFPWIAAEYLAAFNELNLPP